MEGHIEGQGSLIRIKFSHEKLSRLGASKTKCKWCIGFGHINRLCKNPIWHDLEHVPVYIEEDIKFQPTPLEKSIGKLKGETKDNKR